MNNRAMPLKRTILSAALFTAAALPGVTLVENSPFIPSGFQPPEERRQAPERPAPQPTRNLEFRGVYELDGVLHINVHDRSQNKGEWVRINDSSAGFLVTAFSLDNDTITLEIDGRTTELTLSSTQRAPAAPQPQPAVAAGPQRPGSGNQAAVRRRVVTPPQPQTQSGSSSADTPEVRRPVRRVVVPRR